MSQGFVNNSGIGTTTGTGSIVRQTTPTVNQPNLVGTTTNDNAAAGSVGEFVTNSASGVAITSGVQTTVTSISLTAGDWDVWGNIITQPVAGTTQSVVASAINTSVALPSQFSIIAAALTASVSHGQVPPPIRLSLAGTTTVFLVASVTYAVSTLTMAGTLSARRRR